MASSVVLRTSTIAIRARGQAGLREGDKRLPCGFRVSHESQSKEVDQGLNVQKHERLKTYPRSLIGKCPWNAIEISKTQSLKPLRTYLDQPMCYGYRRDIDVIQYIDTDKEIVEKSREMQRLAENGRDM